MPQAADYVTNRSYRDKKGNLVTPVAVIKADFTNPLTADADGASVSHTGAAAAGSRDMTLGGALATGGVVRLDFARNIVIVVTHGSAVVAMSGTIYGTDWQGKNITEDWSVTAGTTSKTYTGVKAFKTVTRITETVAADASANSIVAGSGVKLGLKYPCSVASPLKEIAAGSVVTNGVVVAASTAAAADKYGTYAPNSVPNDTNDYTIYYLSDVPENI